MRMYYEYLSKGGMKWIISLKMASWVLWVRGLLPLCRICWGIMTWSLWFAATRSDWWLFWRVTIHFMFQRAGIGPEYRYSTDDWCFPCNSSRPACRPVCFVLPSLSPTKDTSFPLLSFVARPTYDWIPVCLFFFLTRSIVFISQNPL